MLDKAHPSRRNIDILSPLSQSAMFSNRLKTAVAIATLTPLFSYATAQQTTLGYPAPIDHDANFTKLFSSDFLTDKTWARETWNGVTTFAKTAPLRCFGSELGVGYDVAVLGELLVRS